MAQIANGEAGSSVRASLNELFTRAEYNYLINPSGAINQAGLASTADGAYDFDQWLVLTQTAAVTPSQQTDVEDGTPFMMRLSQAQASAQRMGRIQWIEKNLCRNLRGQSVALSARVRMSASTTLRYAIVEWTGTADSITKDVVNDWTSSTFTTGNFFTSTTTTVVAHGSTALTANTLADITVLTGAVSSSMNNLAVFFWTDSTQAQNVTLDIGNVKLEKGTKSSPFVGRPFADDLRLCQRYWESSYELGTAPGTGSSPGGYEEKVVPSNTVAIGQNYGSVQFVVRKRVAPTSNVTIYGLAGGSGKISNNGGTDLAASSGAVTNETTRGFLAFNNVGSTVTTTGLVVLFHWAATARL